jgi:leucyl aminopeptidase
MVLSLKAIDLKKEKLECLVVPVCERPMAAPQATPLDALVERAMALAEFKGKKGECLSFFEPTGIKATWVELRGLGDPEKLDRETLRVLAGGAVKSAMAAKRTRLHLLVPAEGASKLKPEEKIEAMAEGACLANHVFDRYKAEKKLAPLREIVLVVAPALVKKFRTLVARVDTICEGTRMARNWVSMPANEKSPRVLAGEIGAAARKAGLTVMVLSEKELKQQKFGALLAVAGGSERKPCLLTLEHIREGADKTILLVGKGITFDSGGLNLKQGSGMELMKMDMAGAAAVAASLITAARLSVKATVIGVMPLVENMPSGRACRPGDIIRGFSGKTIEIGNTDAEGRLILADALSWAIDRYQPDITIDLATLTGACLAALGEKIAGIFTTDKELADLLATAGTITHERCWPMPMPEDYREFMKSGLADVQNMSSTKFGGAITAALFLSEFVTHTRWVHLDIAGTAYLKAGGDYCPPGGTGYGVRLLMKLLESMGL